MRRRQRPAHRLRGAIDRMPVETRNAMLDALDGSEIIVGAYTDREGGVCPMLAAHRNGGRTSFATFAQAWDGYTRVGNGSRRASEREVRTLKTMLESSLAAEGEEDLGDAIAAHRAARRGRKGPEGPPPTDTGERDRTSELRSRHGWAWLRPMRRLDEYERVLEELGRHREPTASPPERPRASHRAV